MNKKQELIHLIVASLNQDLDTLIQVAQVAHAAATHEESKAEDSHDTRGLEASYLAGAQSARIEQLKKTITIFKSSNFKDFKANSAINVGAVVDVTLDGKKISYLLASHAGGKEVIWNGRSIHIITPQAPLGEALMGRRAGEDIEIESKDRTRNYQIQSVS